MKLLRSRGRSGDQARRVKPAGEDLRVAAITMCRNEAEFLPRWVDYYGRQLGYQHLYVIDDNSDDGSTEDLPCDVIRIPPVRDGEFEATRMMMAGNLGRALLTVYDALIFCDADEFIVADPDHFTGLLDFVANAPTDWNAVGSIGLNVVHAHGVEAALDFTRPLLAQRHLAKFIPLMCKPALKWVPAHWTAASHGLRAPYQLDPRLWMFHMKFADRDLLIKHADHRAAMVAEDGRAARSNWSVGAPEVVRVLDSAVAGVTDPQGVAEFTPPAPDKLAEFVRENPRGVWRAPKGNQLHIMERRKLVRIPERFRTAF